MTSSRNDDTKQERPLPEASSTRPAKPTTESPSGSEKALNAPATKKSEPYRDIGPELRRMFNDVVKEPIPDDLVALIKKLEEQYGGGGSEQES